MISRAEYQTYVNELQALGQQYDQDIGDQIYEDTTKQQAINKTKKLMPRYQRDLQRLTTQALLEIAGNTITHYQSQITTPLPENLAQSVVKDQFTSRYYGATLAQRLILTRLRLNRVATQTAQVGLEHMGGIFSNSFPFGAQTNVSKRLLQGSAIKVEQDVARRVATEANYPLIRWTLSKDHRVYCDCEALAEAENKDVVSYVKDKGLDLDTKGLYFVEDLPDPPHPNCQCEFNLVGDDEAIPSRGRRPLHHLRNLIRKLLS